MAHIIAVANQKGGVGKTTTTINLASYLARNHNQRVLVVDLDPQANTTSGLGLDKITVTPTIYDVIINQIPAASAIKPTAYPRLSVLPANPNLAAAELELGAANEREFRLKRAFEPLHSDFDLILIDCPPSLGLLTINGLVAADFVLIPVQSEFYALEGLGLLLDTIKRIRQALNPTLRLLGVVITMHNPRTTLSAQVQAQLEHHFPDTLLRVQIPRNIRLAEAPSHGQPINHYDRLSRGAQAYKKLAKEILNRVKKHQ